MRSATGERCTSLTIVPDMYTALLLFISALATTNFGCCSTIHRLSYRASTYYRYSKTERPCEAQLSRKVLSTNASCRQSKHLSISLAA